MRYLEKVLDVGSGTGRIVNILLNAGAEHVAAIEPSDAFQVLENKFLDLKDKVTLLKIKGEEIPEMKVDLAFSVGVIHHIEEPERIIKRIYQVLNPGGKLLIWIYGIEGNEEYLRIVEPIRKITIVLPDFLLSFLSWAINFVMLFYFILNKVISLPIREYMIQVFEPLSLKNRYLIIFDQLNPHYAKYYTRIEAMNLFKHNGFKNVELYHRHGYSWTVIGVK